MPALACVGYRRPAALSKLAIANPKVDSIHPLLFMFGSQRPASKPFLTQRVRPAAQTPTRGLRKDHPCAGRGSPSGGMEELPFWIWLCSFPAAALRLPAGISSASAAGAPSDARRAARLRAASPRFLLQFAQAGCLGDREVWGAPAAETRTVVGLMRVRPGEMWDGRCRNGQSPQSCSAAFSTGLAMHITLRCSRLAGCKGPVFLYPA